MIITTDEQFLLACSYLVNNGGLVVTGERSIVGNERKVYDVRGSGTENTFDITPDAATLEAALDLALSSVAEDVLMSDSSVKKEQARRYLLSQLDNPSSVLNIYTTIRTSIDGNAKFTARVNTMNILATGGVPGWTLNLAVVDTDAKRKQYLMLVIWLFPIVG